MRFRPLLLPPVALAALWAAAVWWPTQSAVATEQDRLAAAQSEQLALVASFDELSSAADRLDVFDADLERFELAIPPTLDMAALVRQIHAEAASSGLRIDLLSPTDVLGGATVDADRPVPAGMASVSMSLMGQAGFEEAIAFVDRLRALPRLVVVDVLGLSAVDGATDQIILDLEFRVFTTEALVPQPAGTFAPLEIETPTTDDATADLESEKQAVLARVAELEDSP